MNEREAFFVQNQRKGSFPFHDGSGWRALTPSTSGLPLLTKGNYTNPAWGALATSALTFSGARAHLSGNQSVNNNANTLLLFDAEDYDTDTYHDNTTNKSRFTAPTTAYYLVIGSVRWDTSALGYRAIHILVDGATLWAESILSPAVDAANPDTAMTVSAVIPLTSTHYAEIRVYQNSGGALNANASNASSWGSIMRMGV